MSTEPLIYKQLHNLTVSWIDRLGLGLDDCILGFMIQCRKHLCFLALSSSRRFLSPHSLRDWKVLHESGRDEAKVSVLKSPHGLGVQSQYQLTGLAAYSLMSSGQTTTSRRLPPMDQSAARVIRLLSAHTWHTSVTHSWIQNTKMELLFKWVHILNCIAT